MLLIAYWLGPYAIILIIEHFVFRRGRYNVDDWNTRSRLPIGWAAIVSMVIGLFGAYLGFAQVFTVHGNSTSYHRTYRWFDPSTLWYGRRFRTGRSVGDYLLLDLEAYRDKQ